jgi:hypothetical protein
VWHYHSNYDTYHWMATYGDPGFHQHRAVGQYLTLLAYHLADDEVLPIDVQNYGVELRAYYDDLTEFLAEHNAELDLAGLSDAIDVFVGRADEVKRLEQLAITLDDKDLIRVVNHKYRDFQRGFISQGGLPDRQYYRHAIFAPGLDTGMKTLTIASSPRCIASANCRNRVCRCNLPRCHRGSSVRPGSRCGGLGDQSCGCNSSCGGYLEDIRTHGLWTLVMNNDAVDSMGVNMIMHVVTNNLKALDA